MPANAPGIVAISIYWSNRLSTPMPITVYIPRCTCFSRASWLEPNGLWLYASSKATSKIPAANSASTQMNPWKDAACRADQVVVDDDEDEGEIVDPAVEVIVIYGKKKKPIRAIIVPPATIRCPYFCDCPCIFIPKLAFLYMITTT